MELENSKGTRDFGPEDKILRNEVIDRLKAVFERYGYSPIETPILEKLEVLNAKDGAGEESDAAKEIFTLTDQGERKLGLRFDLTVPFARFIGMNPNLKMPFKRYQIEPVFRDGPIKLGRYRQFWQCDVDIVGTSNVIVDAELIVLALDAFKELGVDAYIEVNNRKLLRGIIESAGIPDEFANSVMISIDKLKKAGSEGVRKELEEKYIPPKKIEKLLSAFDMEGSFDQKIAVLKTFVDNDIGKEGIGEIEEMFSYFSDEQKEKIVFNSSLARGLSYYTGPIFEGFMRDSEITSSICGGGRYDKLIPLLLGSDKEFPAVGISFGLDVITDALRLEKRAVEKKTVTKAYVIPIRTQKTCFAVCKELRDAGISTDMDFMNKGISKNLNYVNDMGIPFAVIVGSKELEQGKVKLKNMKSGEEELLSMSEVITRILD